MTDLYTRVYSVAFPERLTVLRKERGLTQEQLGDLAELTKLQIHRYERGTSQPTMEALKRLSLALCSSIDELVFEDDERGPDDELKLQFEAVCRLPDTEKQAIKLLIEGMLVKHQTKQMIGNLSK